jgi:hypothetical protein
MEVAVVVDGSVPSQLADQQLLFRLQANRRDLTGWPFWVSLQGSNDPSLWPYHFNGGWECLIAELNQADAWGTHLDFWRIDPAGRFYHLRGLEDDMSHPRSQKPTPGTQLDFYLVASRVTEIISYVLSFARTLGCDERNTALELAFRWSGLYGRSLTSWVVPGRRLRGPESPSHQDSATTQARIPLETPASGLVPYVSTIVAPVYALFGGRSFDPEVIEGIVSETVNRRM